MSVEVVMPQMGESITEGTVSKWLKAVGEAIEKDEPILEISTDKVDAEVPAPGAGILLEIRAVEGETVEVGSVVGVIGEAVSSQQSAVGSQPKAEVIEIPKVEETKPESVAEVAQVVAANATPQISNDQRATNNEPAIEVVMPQMGESITEGTVSKWLKAVGEKIEKDEPLLEISTDKVDAEVPSPSAGILLEIRTQEGETVEVGSIVGLVGAEGASPVSSQQSAASSQFAAQPPAVQETAETVSSVEMAKAQSTILSKQSHENEGRSYDYQRPEVKTNGKSNGEISLDELRRTKSSPLVRNIAKEHGVDISRIAGTGMSGRVTKKDILNFIESGAALRPQDLLVGKTIMPISAPQTVQKVASAIGDRIEPMSVMRKKIAEHMTFSKQTSAHVTSVYEFDMTNVAKFRDKNKAEFNQRFGTKLTFMPFIFQAVTQALRKFPVVNSQVSGEQIIYKGDINLGMAVALDWGLIVPVIKKADTLSLSGLALAANDLADRARTKKLMPDEVAGGTFTITNPGVFGGLFGTPIINQPQVAILCVGTIEKRPKVLTTPDGDDYLAIRQMAYFALTYDHRIVDGADAERFLSFMKNYLETTQFSL
ncbi:2-oxoglutarate dehydrogenase, E2 component, dihydrolipoamide succinyltransferase [soil metagenome]